MVEPVSRSMTISAPADVIFAILADPRQHVLIDGSGTVKATLVAPERLSLGAKFKMRMRLGVPYRITNTVIEFEEGRRMAWRHIMRHTWRYVLEPAELPDGSTSDAATRVTETFDPKTALAPWSLALMRFPERNTAGIERTLERLKRAAESRV
jgi:hypothetical protein